VSLASPNLASLAYDIIAKVPLAGPAVLKHAATIPCDARGAFLQRASDRAWTRRLTGMRLVSLTMAGMPPVPSSPNLLLAAIVIGRGYRLVGASPLCLPKTTSGDIDDEARPEFD
jgi:hypothetical protein